MQKSKIKKPKKRSVYLDFASATPMDTTVLKKMEAIFKQDFANASSVHHLGVEVRAQIDEARGRVASILGAHRDEIVFTSGATESNNLAILGVLGGHAGNALPLHIVTTNVEHSSVYELCRFLERDGFAGRRVEVSYVEVDADGLVDSKAIKKAIKKNTVLVSVIYANNEIGTVIPVRDIAKAIRHYKKHFNPDQDILLHTDASQAMNYLPVRTETLGVDLLSFNSAKIYGPKGIGVLFKKRGVKLAPIMRGGSQEFGLRPGTENAPLVVGLQEALEKSEAMKEAECKRLRKLQEYFFKKIEKIDGVVINGSRAERLPNNINITIPRIPSDLLVIELAERGVCVSEKSACKSGDKKGSYVIEAIRKASRDFGALKEEDTLGSVRLSMGRQTQKEDIDYVLRCIFEIVSKLEKWYK